MASWSAARVSWTGSAWISAGSYSGEGSGDVLPSPLTSGALCSETTGLAGRRLPYLFMKETPRSIARVRCGGGAGARPSNIRSRRAHGADAALSGQPSVERQERPAACLARGCEDHVGGVVADEEADDDVRVKGDHAGPPSGYRPPSPRGSRCGRSRWSPCEELFRLVLVEDGGEDQPALVIDADVELTAGPELELLAQSPGDCELASGAHRQGGHGSSVGSSCRLRQRHGTHPE
jgi:hypothetical protein